MEDRGEVHHAREVRNRDFFHGTLACFVDYPLVSNDLTTHIRAYSFSGDYTLASDNLTTHKHAHLFSGH